MFGSAGGGQPARLCGVRLNK